MNADWQKLALDWAEVTEGENKMESKVAYEEDPVQAVQQEDTMRPTEAEEKLIVEAKEFIKEAEPFSWHARAMIYKDVIRAQNWALTRKNRRIKSLQALNELLTTLMGERAVKQVVLWKKKAVIK